MITASIIGTGWITPLGRDINSVWRDFQEGRLPEVFPLRNPVSGRSLPVLPIPAGLVADVAGYARLRRSSVISHFAVAAAADAAARAGLDSEMLSRTALVFAASDGGVVYTRRFYSDVVERGAGAGSPLLFPETVYNAPASHIAARLGLTGEVVTLVGDAAAGLAAVRVGCELLAAGEADFCLVAAAQELDWITAEAYARWGLIRPESGDKPGTFFSEGAAAIVLARQGGCGVEARQAGLSFSTDDNAGVQLEAVLDEILSGKTPGVAVCSDSGNQLGHVEGRVLRRRLPGAQIIAPKFIFGEALASSSLQQIIVALKILEKSPEPSEVLVSAVGFNGQISALVLTGSNTRA